MEASTADPINLKIARYKPNEINNGVDIPIAAITTHH
jgi:hypothetical protein